jgi:hypothetical protein
MLVQVDRLLLFHQLAAIVTDPAVVAILIRTMVEDDTKVCTKKVEETQLSKTMSILIHFLL